MRFSALVIAACAIGRPAAAADLSIVADPAELVAPATVTVSAQSIGEALSYRWSGLPNYPRCRTESCTVTVPVASCTAIELEAVDSTGHTQTATRALCANDDRGGVPPRAHLVIRGDRVTTQVNAGSDTIVIRRAWIDGVENTVSPLDFALDVDSGCHAVDVLVVDRAGRFAIAQKSVCLGEAVKLWIGGTPSTFVPIGDRFELCGESAHPVGLGFMRTAGDAEIKGCGGERIAPRSLTRSFATVVDENQVESTASAFLAAVPATAPPVLFFANGPETASVVAGKQLTLSISLYGGSAPFTTSLPGARVQGTGTTESVELVIDRVELAVGTMPLAFTVRDDRGLEAALVTTLTVSEGRSMSSPDPVALDRGAACRCLDVAEGAPHLHLLLAFVAFALIRRRR